MTAHFDINPSGLCQCGCGRAAPIAVKNDKNKGWIKGKPVRFVNHHHLRLAPNLYNVNPATGCWEWARGKTGSGYGAIKLDGKQHLAHRLFYERYNGSIPVGMVVRHRCDNRGCVNPEHLLLGTQSDNLKDCADRGRLPEQCKPKTHCHRGHPLSGDNLYVAKGHRFCRVCDRIRGAEYRARQRQKKAVMAHA